MPTYLGVVHANCSERKVGHRGTDCRALGTSDTLQNIRLGKYQSPSFYVGSGLEPRAHLPGGDSTEVGGNEEGRDSV